jgi:eukaryotic-like serine/threonine-protein kinase
METGRWQRLQTVFHEATNLPEAEWELFLHTACGADRELADEVLSMLRHDAASSLLDRQLDSTASDLLDTADPVVSRELGPYRIIRLLGEGGMGVVYLAERSDLQVQVAIKVLRDAWLSPSRRERFLSEQRTLAQLNHPSIARLYDAAVLPDGTPFFVMEYIDGAPLVQYCRSGKCVIERRLQLFRDVCEAVQHAHSHAVIHRDLKPSNILVKDDGGVRLLDFGIAKQIESLDLKVDQTMTGLRLMTPAYAAPEQIRGDRVGISTDVYSLGVILYELLAGESPFDLSNLTPAEAATVIVDHAPGKPSAEVRHAGPERDPHAFALPRAAWSDLDVLCLTAMHKDPQRRYPSVEALVRDLDHYLHGEPLQARPDRVSYRIAKFVRRNRAAVTTAVLVFAIINTMAAYFTVRLTKARDTALAEAARTRRIQNFMASLFQGGDPSAGPDNNLRVLTLLDRGVQQAQALNGDPEVQSELFDTLGGLYQNLGKLDTANSLLTSSLSLRKSLFGSDSPQVGETLVALGRLRDDQAQLPEAENLIRQGLDIETRHLSPGHAEIAKATTALGKVLEDRGAYDNAIQTLTRATKLQPSGVAMTPELADTLYELANCHFYAGHYDTAENLNQQLLLVYQELYGPNHPRVADVLVNLAAIRHDRGHYSEAEKLERQALQIVENWYGEDSPVTASDLTMLARTLVFQERYEEATALLRRSLSIKEKIYGPVHPSVASSLNELGNTASREHKYDEAELDFTRMVSIYHAIYGDHHYLVGIATSNLATAYAGQQQWSRAETLFRQAIQIFTETQSANHINTGIARVKLGHVLLSQRKFSDAEAESRGGYDILIKQIAPTASWLVNAREDLIKEYDALKQPQNSQHFRAELASLPIGKPTKISGK